MTQSNGSSCLCVSYYILHMVVPFSASEYSNEPQNGHMAGTYFTFSGLLKPLYGHQR